MNELYFFSFESTRSNLILIQSRPQYIPYITARKAIIMNATSTWNGLCKNIENYNKNYKAYITSKTPPLKLIKAERKRIFKILD